MVTEMMHAAGVFNVVKNDTVISQRTGMQCAVIKAIPMYQWHI